MQLRLPGSGDIITYLASAPYDARDSRSITQAQRQGRIQAHAYLEILRSLPGHGNMYLVSTSPNFGTASHGMSTRSISCERLKLRVAPTSRTSLLSAAGAWSSMTNTPRTLRLPSLYLRMRSSRASPLSPEREHGESSRCGPLLARRSPGR